MPVPIAAVRGRASVTGGSVAAPTGEYRKSITVESTLVSADLTDFPVLVKLASDSDLAAHAVNGDDLYITTSDGATTCPHEIEYFDPATGELVLWFKAPSLSSSVDTVFYLYYGDSGHANSEDLAGVWDANYKMVHNFSYAWREAGTQPVLSGEFASVVKSGSTYYAYYSNSTSILYATSSDGTTWTAQGTVLTGSVGKFDANRVWLPRVWIEGSTWYMLYTGRPTSGGARAIGLATSSDGATWTKQNSGNAVLSGTAATWDADDCELASIIKVGSTYYMYYNNQLGTRDTGVATSSDLISWTKDANNPIFDGGRFCGDVFKIGSYYYYITPHYPYSTDYSELELWRDTNPTFYSADREFMGIVKSIGNGGAWNDIDQDVPWVVTDTIERDSFDATNGELWCYLSGNDGSTWATGLIKTTPAQWAMKGAGLDSKSTNDLNRSGSNYVPPYQIDGGILGGGLGYTGSRQYGVAANASDFDMAANSAFTWEAVVKPASVAAGFRAIMTLRDFSSADTAAKIGLWQSGDDLYMEMRNDGGSQSTTATQALTLAAGTTYRVGLSRDTSGNIKIWLNGTSYAVGSAVSGAITPDQGPYIGAHYLSGATNANQGFNGEIAHVRISNTERSADWHATAYQCELNNASFITLGAEEAV